MTFELISVKSGKSRFIMNLAMGIRRAGNNAVVFSLYVSKEVSSYFAINKVEEHSETTNVPSFFSFRAITYSDHLAKKLTDIVKQNEECDVYIVIGDYAIPVINHMDGRKTVYVSNGDWSLIHLIRDFKGLEKVGSKVLRHGFISSIRKHATIAKRFDLVLGNSKFTANLMSFLYGFPITGFVYPPVDQELFRPTPSGEMLRSPYAMAMLRNEFDPMYAHVERLARITKVIVVGGANVAGADNLGFVSDSKLVELYTKSVLTLSPNVREFFGYTIAESLNCGTPVIAFDNAGASEMIKDGVSGWLAGDINDLEKRVLDVMHNGYDQEMRTNCVSEGKKFSIESSTSALLKHLEAI